jgi:NAD(P)-dependent dehydrogenase (short-subunit alcohol dehydrogenase family)
VKTIRGKKALVTGAASGIGRAIATALAGEGADLFLVDIDEANLHGTADEVRRLGAEAVASICDLSDPAQISAMVSKLLSAWGRLDILVNNAGVAYYGHTLGMSQEQWTRVLAINLLAPIQLTRELLPTLLRAQEPHIVNICSILGLVTWRRTTAYQTSKHGLVGFTEGLRCEYGARIGVSAICPGMVTTPMIERLGEVPPQGGGPGERPLLPPRWTFTSPDKVAAESIAAIQRNRSLVVITPAARVLWWLKRLFPAGTGWVIGKLGSTSPGTG